MSQVHYQTTDLVRLVRRTPIILVARLAQPEPGRRLIEFAADNREGEQTTVRFEGRVWSFAVLEVLHNRSKVEFADPLPVIDATLERDFEIHVEAVLTRLMISPIYQRYENSGAVSLDTLGDGEAVLFLVPSEQARDEEFAMFPSIGEVEQGHGTRFSQVFRDCYPFAAVGSIEEASRRDEIVKLIGGGK
jgi:hypothetical protein